MTTYLREGNIGGMSKEKNSMCKVTSALVMCVVIEESHILSLQIYRETTLFIMHIDENFLMRILRNGLMFHLPYVTALHLKDLSSCQKLSSVYRL